MQAELGAACLRDAEDPGRLLVTAETGGDLGQRSLRGGIAGAVATVVMTLERPLEKRLFDSKYDDVEIQGELVTRGDGWQPIG